MKLLTKDLINKFPKLGATSNMKFEDVDIIVKFFGGGACNWYATEFDGKDTFFGYVNMGDDQCAELGYFSLSELETIKFPPFGLGIERDMYYEGHKLKEVMV